jgi:hypothetical protein
MPRWFVWNCRPSTSMSRVRTRFMRKLCSCVSASMSSPSSHPVEFKVQSPSPIPKRPVHDFHNNRKHCFSTGSNQARPRGKNLRPQCKLLLFHGNRSLPKPPSPRTRCVWTGVSTILRLDQPTNCPSPLNPNCSPSFSPSATPHSIY